MVVLVLSLGLPLAMPVVAESIVLAGVENECTSKSGMECLAWANERRWTGQRWSHPLNRIESTSDRMASGHGAPRRESPERSGHRLPVGLLVPLRC